MQIELTIMEKRTVLAALAVYHKIKSAERMLESQKKNANAQEVRERYDKLLYCVKTIQEKL